MHLAVTLGDSRGVTIRLLHPILERLSRECSNLAVYVIGSFAQWNWHVDHFKLGRVDFKEVFTKQDFSVGARSGLYFVDLGNLDGDPRHATEKELGMDSKASLDFIKRFNPKSKLAVVTCPINKFHVRQAGFAYPGQTEFFEDIWDGNGIMVLAGEKLRVGLVTNHLAVSDIPNAITPETLESKVLSFDKTLRSLGISKPRIAICGLNPHCGDHGLFGKEDEEIIKPTIDRVSKKFPSLDLTGPLPADTAFYFQFNGQYDGVLAQYHDQGLGPLKTVHFDSAINITGGLECLRVSPDHGPAADRFDLPVSGKSIELAFEVAMRHLTESSEE